jgi:hypothetical protein
VSEIALGRDVGGAAGAQKIAHPIPETVAEAGELITSVVADTHGDEAVKQVSTDGPREVVTDGTRFMILCNSSLAIL